MRCALMTKPWNSCATSFALENRWLRSAMRRGSLIDAGVVRGRTLTSWPAIKTDVRNAGGSWVDADVVVDNGLVTSRKPDDIPAFNEKMIEEFCEGRHTAKPVAAELET